MWCSSWPGSMIRRQWICCCGVRPKLGVRLEDGECVVVSPWFGSEMVAKNPYLTFYNEKKDKNWVQVGTGQFLPQMVWRNVETVILKSSGHLERYSQWLIYNIALASEFKAMYALLAIAYNQETVHLIKVSDAVCIGFDKREKLEISEKSLYGRVWDDSCACRLSCSQDVC